MTDWILLSIAIIFEVVGTSLLKTSNGFTKLLPSIGSLCFYTVSFYLLSITLRRMEVGVAYALWSGLGTALVACIGIFYFNESLSPVKMISLALIIIGAIGLNLSSQAH